MHVFAVFAVYPAPIKEAAFGRLSTKGAGGLRPPAPFVDSFLWWLVFVYLGCLGTCFPHAQASRLLPDYFPTWVTSRPVVW